MNPRTLHLVLTTAVGLPIAFGAQSLHTHNLRLACQCAVIAVALIVAMLANARRPLTPGSTNG